VQEIRGIRAVRVNPADLCGGNDRDVGPFSGHERLDRRLARQVKLGPVPQQELDGRLLSESPDEG
jgi:hypothetical protein